MDKENKEYKRQYPKKWWNPRLIEFLEVNEDKTLIGFAWSCYWRLTIVVGGIYFGIVILAVFLAAL